MITVFPEMPSVNKIRDLQVLKSPPAPRSSALKKDWKSASQNVQEILLVRPNVQLHLSVWSLLLPKGRWSRSTSPAGASGVRMEKVLGRMSKLSLVLPICLCSTQGKKKINSKALFLNNKHPGKGL